MLDCAMLVGGERERRDREDGVDNKECIFVGASNDAGRNAKECK
jgi:hypothetical protein